ncbi:hypothetical protein [Terasakiella pusilla]|jgi:hypothetical protein|uniref:hypothetical protein n=1 Tax=Terasakiella pusilla TaxID=64973 RepID=UPI00146F9EC6|nr:hypothetical protein [Terasakiella pusilla]
MKAEDHRKVAQWHLKQAELHEASGDYACGCPANEENTRIIEIVESGKIDEENECSLAS